MKTAGGAMAIRARAWGWVAAVCVTAPLVGQRGFGDGSWKVHLPQVPESAWAFAVGDVDLDGDLDVVVGNGDPGLRQPRQQNRLFRNDGDGSFSDITATHLPAQMDMTNALALADFDGDGDLDLFVANGEVWRFTGEPNALWLNDGTGRFVDASATHLPPDPLDRNATVALAAGDVDADGDLDLVLGNGSFRPNRLYLNDGSAHFVDATSTQLPADLDTCFGLALADLDGDLDLDLVVGNLPAQNRIYVNDGLGRFVDETATRLQTTPDWTTSVAVGDLDADGDVDLLFGNVNRELDRLFENDGQGVFTGVPWAPLPPPSTSTLGVEMVDLDGDGDLDLALAADGSNTVYRNDGSWVFVAAATPSFSFRNAASAAIAAADLDADGDDDLLVGNGYLDQRNRLFDNDGNIGLTDATATRVPIAWTNPKFRNNPSTMAIADLDADGVGELLVGRHDAGPALLVQDGGGVFTPDLSGRLPALAVATPEIVVGDVDADGDLDLVLGGVEQPPFGPWVCRLFVNDGSGAFGDETAARLPAGCGAPAALGDLDRDGDLDLVAGGGPTPIAVWRNDGTGHFVEPGVVPNGTAGADLHLGDVDLDGDLDIVIGDRQCRLYLNDGAARFTDATATHLPAAIFYTQEIALCDVDGDGDPDLICANGSTGAPHGHQNRLLLNDGAGRFTDGTAGRMPVALDETWAVAAADVDGDGDLDLAFANGGDSVDAIYLNDGRGTFVDATAAWIAPAQSYLVVARDVDGDGDVDLMFDDRVCNNRLRQLDARWLLRPGRPYELAVSSEPGRASTLRVALPLVAPRRGRTVLDPFGVLELDPGTLVALEPVYLPPRSGGVTVTIQVPNDAGLVGAVVSSQALIFDPFGVARFTNVVSDRVVR